MLVRTASARAVTTARPKRQELHGRWEVVARTVGSAAERTRQRILATASHLFVERGYASTSIRDISDRLGMTKGSLYYHFSSKEDLLVALLAPLLDAVDAFAAAARASGGVSYELVRRLVDVLDEHAPMLRSFIDDPSVQQLKANRRELPARFIELQEILGGGTEAAAMLRGRCALGVIHAGVLAPRVQDCPPESGTHSIGRTPAPTTRLSEADKTFVTNAAIAVLALPVQ
jgi:AcrR family transcriptional regulator